MVSSTEKEEMGIADCGVGSIVWVRRRNGSWWPGKILGPDELSTALLVSPRSGTPIKLLGREDASVDWYNLEKSKRVKPFRCGEFDESIERAESALGMPPKKREKYARREDAILHALELEKQQLDDKSGNLGSPIDGYYNKSSDPVKKETVISSECSRYGSKKDVNIKRGSRRLVATTEDEDTKDQIKERESFEVPPRMSGLQNLGIRTARSKQKRSSSTLLNGSRKVELDNFDQDLPISGLINENTNISGIRSSLQKKRYSPNDVLTNEPLVKRRDRRHSLDQVLRKSEKLPYEPDDCSDEDKLVSPIEMTKSPSHMDVNNFSCPIPFNEESGSESTETDSSKTHSMDSDEDDEMVVGLSESAFVPELDSESPEMSGQLRHVSTSSELPNENCMSRFNPRDTVPASLGASKWQIKRKRNNRSFSRRSTEATDRWVARGSMYTAGLEEVDSDGFDETYKIEKNFKIQKRAYYNEGYISTPKASFTGYDDVSHKLYDWEDLAWKKQPLMRGYWDHLDPTLGYHRLGGRMSSGLVHVDLKVQSSYQREHVPMISLMSKLNGKAIVGHPIQVEILENGSTDSLLSSADGIGFEVSNNDAVVPAVWRTAKRSASFRVPRSQSIEQFQNVNSKKKAPFSKSGVGKILKKSPKKTTLSSNQKTRNLHVIGREQRLSHNLRSGNKVSLIKGEAGPTTVACIPLKLVFSRLNEEMGSRHQ